MLENQCISVQRTKNGSPNVSGKMIFFFIKPVRTKLLIISHDKCVFYRVQYDVTGDVFNEAVAHHQYFVTRVAGTEVTNVVIGKVFE